MRFGPIGKDAAHVCIDMQMLFAEGTVWATPRVLEIAPAVARICEANPERTIFTRFMTPARAEQASGQLQIFYRRWSSMLASKLSPDAFDLVPALRKFVPPAAVIDKATYSAYEAPAFQQSLDDLSVSTLIFTGVETDACVLATVLTAVDRGLRVILVSDAIASGSDAGHGAAMTGVYPRYDMQIEAVTADQLLEEWKP